MIRQLMCVCLLAALSAPPAQASAEDGRDRDDPTGSFLTESEIAELVDLSQVLNSHLSVSFGRGGAECGMNGKCNHVMCPEPDCDPDSTPVCACEVAGECGPFWDRIPTYDCKCSCQSRPSTPEPPSPPEPDECTVYNPLTGNCLVPVKTPKVEDLEPGCIGAVAMAVPDLVPGNRPGCPESAME